MLRRLRLIPFLVGMSGLLLAACGGDDTAPSGGGASGDAAEQPVVVVTTNILGDVVESFAGEQVDVVTIMPVGADPHDFQASAQQANAMRQADAMIVNGAAFEEGLLDVIDAATEDGTPTYEAISGVDSIDFDGDDHDDHGDEGDEGDDHEGDHDEHGDHDEGGDHDDEGDDHDDHDHDDDEHEAEGEHDEHDHEGVDPHFFTDPARMAVAVDGIADFLVANVDGIDRDALRTSADDYIEDLENVDAEVESILAELDDEQRVLITNHEVFGYFADRYGFEIVGTVIPSGSTADGADAGALAALAELIEDEGVRAIFADTSSTNELADTLADEVDGDVTVVELFTESLGESDSDGATYLDMVRANADRIVAALAG